MQPQAQNKPQQTSLAKKMLKIILIIAGILFGLAVIFIFLLIFALNGGIGGVVSGNQAKKAFKPISAQLKPLHSEFVCDNGDGGHGIDNDAGWYTAYYLVPKSVGLQQIGTIITDHGYETVTASGTDGAAARYLKSDTNIEVTTMKSGASYPLYCNTGEYGRQYTPDQDHALVEFDVEAVQLR